MLIPLGILASAGGASAAYELISTTVLGSNTSTVTFSSIDTATYKHLQVRFVARNSNGGASVSHRFTLNGSSTGYADHALEGNGSSVSSGNNTSQTYGRLGRLPAAGTTANVFGAGVIDILDPFSTTKNKTVRSLSGTAGYNYVSLYSSLWANTAAVTSISLFCESDNFVTGSRFSLYGLRGA